MAETAFAAAAAILAHPAAKGLLLAPGAAEDSFYWMDSDEGVLCRCRPDFLHGGGECVVDIKTTRDASLAGFARSAANYRYHVQAAWYLDGVEAVTGARPERFVFVAAEKEPPYEVAAYEASEDFIAAGRALCRENLHTYAECLFFGEWPGYPEAVMPLDLPLWARFQAEGAKEAV
jgi:exodeoxyribonuclease VIII